MLENIKNQKFIIIQPMEIGLSISRIKRRRIEEFQHFDNPQLSLLSNHILSCHNSQLQREREKPCRKVVVSEPSGSSTASTPSFSPGLSLMPFPHLPFHIYIALRTHNLDTSFLLQLEILLQALVVVAEENLETKIVRLSRVNCLREDLFVVNLPTPRFKTL